MANKGGLLATLGKRILGFSTSSNCCAGPTAEEAKTPATKSPDLKAVEMTNPDTAAQGAGCCAPSCCESTSESPQLRHVE